jgi:hypothetical protein
MPPRMVSPTLLQNTLRRLSSARYAVVVVDREAGAWIAAVVPWPGSSVDPVPGRDRGGARRRGGWVVHGFAG